MLHQGKIIAALEAKRGRFTEVEETRQEDMDALSQALETLAALSLPEIESRLAHIGWPGARPTAEQEQHQGVVIPFGESWSNHRQAREWALGVLRGVPTFAADGSQISPARDISIPVAVVQVGWFENRHQVGAAYVKDVAVELLAPDELGEDEGEESGFPNWQVTWRRFEMEVERLVSYMQAHAGARPRPLCFFDGSLVVSFAQHMRPERQRLYVDAVLRLLDASGKTGVPLVGYVDTSYANDLTVMLAHLAGLSLSGRVSDAGLLRPRMRWGDRTQVYVCARDDEVQNKYYDGVCFVYLKTTADNPPARVEFPRWLCEEGEQKQVLDLVRAECVVGTGYPYSLETADSVAVLTMQDRERFYRLFQRFAEQRSCRCGSRGRGRVRGGGGCSNKERSLCCSAKSSNPIPTPTMSVRSMAPAKWKLRPPARTTPSLPLCGWG